MRIAVDATAAAIQTAGVGRYTRELLRALLQLPDRDRYNLLVASDADRARQLLEDLPPGAWRDLRRLPASERWMTAFWHRLSVPLPVDVFAGKFDVYHGPDFVAPPSRRPSVVTIHDLSYIVAPQYSEPSLAAYLKSAVPRSLQRASQIITVSATVAAELIDTYPLVRDRVRAIPNGVHPLSPRSSHEPSTGQPTILTVGTIEPRKNLITILDAMPYVWAESPDARLIVAGRIGWQSDQIMERLRAACASSRVEYVNTPSDAELAELYETAHVFAYPSAYEGFGLPVLEAMARNVPVITSDISVLRETAGSAARYVDAFDPEALGCEIVRLLDDSRMRTDLVSAGRQRVAQHPWSETARRTRMAYHDAAHGRTRWTR